MAALRTRRRPDDAQLPRHMGRAPGLGDGRRLHRR
jgi:hypothetical protein